MPNPYPDLDLLRRQAKKLLRQADDDDPQALRLFPPTDRPPQLADAQYAVAKVVGFPRWCGRYGPPRGTGHARNCERDSSWSGAAGVSPEAASTSTAAPD